MIKKWWPTVSKVLIVVCLCLMVLPIVSCKKDDKTTPTATVKTPLQLLNETVQNQFTSIGFRDDRQDQDLQNHANRIGTLEGSLAIDLTPLTNRVIALESLNVSSNCSINMSGYTTTLNDAVARITYIETFNISARLTRLESALNLSPTPTPTPQPNSCIVQKPNAIYPNDGNMSVPNGSIMFQWNSCVNADHYEFWFGTDSSNLTLRKNISAPFHFYEYPATSGATFYYWKIVSVSVCNVTATDAWWFKTQ